jgi:hypothetical protein
MYEFADGGVEQPEAYLLPVALCPRLHFWLTRFQRWWFILLNILHFSRQKETHVRRVSQFSSPLL